MIRTTEYLRRSAVCGLVAATACTPQANLLDLEQTITVAVTPALNHSGSQDFDPLRVADLMASELAQLPGVRVIPLNRVLAQLDAEGRDRIESAEQAFSVMERVGADAVVVFAVAEYDPYLPPVFGVSAQLLGSRRQVPHGFDPVAASRQPAPVEPGDLRQIRGAYQRVFHGSDEQVQQEIRTFARRRDAEGSPYGWKKFLASQESFVRFCCHVTARELIQQEVTQVLAWRVRQNEEGLE